MANVYSKKKKKNKGQFLVCGNGTIFSSPDGQKWTPFKRIDLGQEVMVTSLTYVGGHGSTLVATASLSNSRVCVHQSKMYSPYIYLNANTHCLFCRLLFWWHMMVVTPGELPTTLQVGGLTSMALWASPTMSSTPGSQMTQPFSPASWPLSTTGVRGTLPPWLSPGLPFLTRPTVNSLLLGPWDSSRSQTTRAPTSLPLTKAPPTLLYSSWSTPLRTPCMDTPSSSTPRTSRAASGRARMVSSGKWSDPTRQTTTSYTLKTCGRGWASDIPTTSLSPKTWPIGSLSRVRPSHGPTGATIVSRGPTTREYGWRYGTNPPMVWTPTTCTEQSELFPGSGRLSRARTTLAKRWFQATAGSCYTLRLQGSTKARMASPGRLCLTHYSLLPHSKATSMPRVDISFSCLPTGVPSTCPRTLQIGRSSTIGEALHQSHL